LVIRFSAMGDVAMTIHVLLALLRDQPELRITVVTKPLFAAIFDAVPQVTVFEVDLKGRHKGIRGLWAMYKELKVTKVDAVADLHNVLRSNILKRYFKLGGTPFVQINKGRAAKKQLTAAKSKVFTQLKSTHERYADVFRNLGFTIRLSKTDILSKLQLRTSTIDRIENDAKKWIGIAPFAAHSGKTYPLRLMKKVLIKLENTKKYKIILFGGSNEAEQLSNMASEINGCISTAGILGFDQEIALISNLDIMVSMDSGNGHLAAMFGIPTLTIWGVTHPYAGFYPFGQDLSNALLADRTRYPLIPTSVYGNRYPKGYETAIASISTEEIVAKIIAMT